jgi:hypothetical protein
MIKLSEGEFEVTLSGEAKREAPVRTEPHPTRSFYLEVRHFVPLQFGHFETVKPG